MSERFDLTGQVAVITGAAGGLGSEIALAMSEQGATVVLSDQNQELCAQIRTQMLSAGHSGTAIACDLSIPDEIERLVFETMRLYGRVNTLVCNAGVQGPSGPLALTTDADWQFVMDVNLRSTARLCNKVIPSMIELGGGSITLMTSIAGLRGNRNIGLYGLSKAAVAQLARNLAVEWGPSGVRVNAISPGLIRTPLAAELMKDANFMSRRLSLTPLRRVGEPHEVAGLVVLLASDAGGFITGQNLVIDGGTTISDGS
jgi:NAD(P)-dependent dehydrogenase (short-subunit alcohol dehydrogenase family)